MSKLTKNQIAILSAAVAATSENSHIYTSGRDQTVLVKAGYIETNEAISNAEGIATRATESGIAFIKDSESSVEESNVAETGAEDERVDASDETYVETVAKPAEAKFVIASNIEIPEKVKAKRKSVTAYPFDSLEIGQSFFVPASDKKPNPAKSLASTITTANDRYAYEIEGETEINRRGQTVPKKGYNKKFIVRPIKDGAAWGYDGVEGAAVWRIDPRL